MTAEILPSGMAMTGSPILVKVTASGEKYVQVCVKHDNKEIFSTSGIPDTNGNIEFRIDEVLKMLLTSRIVESADLLVAHHRNESTNYMCYRERTKWDDGNTLRRMFYWRGF